LQEWSTLLVSMACLQNLADKIWGNTIAMIKHDGFGVI
jgi:hypothetical protein